MSTDKVRNIIQPKGSKTKKKKKKVKDIKMVDNINKMGPRLSKLSIVFAPGPPPDIETITEFVLDFEFYAEF